MSINKRHLLAGASLSGLAGAAGLFTGSAAAQSGGSKQPTLLTVSGSLPKGNRGPFDPVVDQMMGKHGIKFDKAFTFDAAALAKLPAVTIMPTLEYDAKVHELRGPLLSSVLAAAGVPAGSAVMLGLRAVDGYNVAVSLADATTYRMIVATQLDGQAMALGGLGPQWAVYDADRVAPFKDKPLKERFALCPWGLYHIDVKPA